MVAHAVTASAGLLRLDAADLVATAGGDVTLAELDEAARAAGAWVALDAPGPRTRRLRDALGSGTPGPLAAFFGPPRDQVIGLAFRAGDGTLVRTGGRVVKNVAGFDLAKLVVGGHGAFGVVEEAHLRLRARPEADATRLWLGGQDDIAIVAARLMHAGCLPAAFEVVSPSAGLVAGGWGLLMRAMGTGVGVEEELEAASALAGESVSEVPVADDVWPRWSGLVGAWQVCVRIGTDPSRWNDAVHLASKHGATAFSVTVPRGTVRAHFEPGRADALRALRRDAAARGWPVTIETADAATLASVGVWGAMPAGTLRIAQALRATLGPEGTQGIPLWVDTA